MVIKAEVGKIILVSNRLPATIVETAGKLTTRRSMGGLATALTSVFERPGTVWVGWTGLPRLLGKHELASLSLPAGMVPVNLSAQQAHSYYDRFACGGVWPAFHHFTPRRLYSETDWQTMFGAVKKFAQEIVRIAGPKDVIWIHDFHLSVLPRLLRDAGLKNRIGFFLHTPFPEPKFMKILPHYQDILDGLAQVDVLGFQTERDVRHFREAAEQLLPGKRYPQQVRSFPIGIDYIAYHSAATQPEAVEREKQLRRTLGSKLLILSISRLDYTKGIVTQLLAVEGLLAGMSEAARQNLIYKVIVAPSREGTFEYRELKKEIDATVRRINKRFATRDWQPVDYEYHSQGFEGVVAHCQQAEIFLVAPVIDGMNLLAKEYVASRQDGNGVLVLSANAGAAVQLHEAMLVDPTDVAGITAALRKAMDMPAKERERRWQALRTNVQTENVQWWADSFLDALYH